MTRWSSNPQKAIIQLSLRYKTNDVLWFTFFHELAHILKHKKEPFITTQQYRVSEVEKEADNFAASVLLPPDKYGDFIKENDFSKSSIVKFARIMEVHPGIVVGRLQKEGYIEYYQFNDLKVRYEWKL